MSQNISYDDNYKLFKQYQVTRSVDLRNEIALKNKNLIYKGIRGLYSPIYNDIEELEQEAFICLLKAVETFDVDKGFKFSTYAMSCIRAITMKRADYKKDVSLDEPLSNLDNENVSLVDTVEDERIDIEKECFNKEIRRNIKILLTDEEYKIITLFYIKRTTIKEIAKELQTTTKEIQRIRKTAERKIYNSELFQEYNAKALYYDEITYLSAYDYSNPKVQTSNISNPVMEAVLKREKRDFDILRNVLLKNKK